jgi:hypothetical protein
MTCQLTSGTDSRVWAPTIPPMAAPRLSNTPTLPAGSRMIHAANNSPGGAPVATLSLISYGRGPGVDC